MDINKTKWTRKDQKFMKCICCDKFTINRHDGWWVHKKCLGELINFIVLWKASAYGIKMELIDWKKAISLHSNYDPNKIKEYNEKLTNEAFQVFIERYGAPSWVENPSHNCMDVKNV